MRLIDADALLEYFDIGSEEARKENRGEIITAEDVDKFPTAYDVDKVVEQLEKDILELKEQLIYMSNEDMAVRLRCKMHGLDRGIEIVKAGGVNEQSITI